MSTLYKQLNGTTSLDVFHKHSYNMFEREFIFFPLHHPKLSPSPGLSTSVNDLNIHMLKVRVLNAHFSPSLPTPKMPLSPGYSSSGISLEFSHFSLRHYHFLSTLPHHFPLKYHVSLQSCLTVCKCKIKGSRES